MVSLSYTVMSCKTRYVEDERSLRELILSDGTEFHFLLGYLSKQNDRIIEEAPYDTVQVALVRSRKGLTPITKQVSVDIEGYPIFESDYKKATVYRNFVATTTMVKSSCTIFLGDKMLDKDTLYIAPEIEEESFAFYRLPHQEQISFWLNDSIFKLPINLYQNPNQSTITYDQFGFLDHEDLPIQAFHRVVMPNSSDWGDYFKLYRISY